jgi:GTP-binding protein
MGVVYWGKTNENHFTVADIPGLIEGAHEGKGLGVQFLRHVERTTLLLHLVDVSINGSSDPVKDLKTVRTELTCYQTGLEEKPFMVAATKMDVAGESVSKLKRYCIRKKILFFEISAATGAGIPPLIRAMSKAVATAKKAITQENECLIID